MRGTRTVGLAVGLLAGLAAASAQGGTAPKPSETTETFGSWVVRCQQPPAAAPRACEILHSVQGQGGVITQVAIGTPPGKDAPVIVVQTPLGILVPQPVTLGDAAQPVESHMTIPFQTCLPAGCIAQLETTNKALDALAALRNARLSFSERTGRRIEITVPLDGMKDALARLRAL